MSTPRELEFDYEITVVDGERGRHLAAEQAASIMEVLEWFHIHRGPCQSNPADRVEDEDDTSPRSCITWRTRIRQPRWAA